MSPEPPPESTAVFPDEVRARLALALDVDDLVDALRLARQVRPWFGVAKVGLELYSAAGPDAVGALAEDEEMLRAGVEGLHDGAAAAGLPEPVALAVTVLTSDGSAPPHIVPHRIALAVEAGCGGIVCAAGDVRDAKSLAPRLMAVVPGIRLPGDDDDDQARTSTPAEAVEAGADLLVLGRSVTRADDPTAAAAAVAAAVRSAT
jgi:orotidine-5'-phosphate decarboxylase